MSDLLHILPPTAFVLLLGAVTTIAVSLMGNALGLLIGTTVCLMRLSLNRSARFIAAVYISFFRGVPLLVQLLIVYYFLPMIALDLPPFFAAVIGLGMCSGAYQAENLRGGERSLLNQLHRLPIRIRPREPTPVATVRSIWPR